jgi:hypothetical protein
MKQSATMLLNCVRLPARVGVEDAALLLGFEPYEIPVLIRLRLLKPLGNPKPNGHKWFASQVIQELSQDEKWLARATDALAGYFRQKNASLSVRHPFESQENSPQP